MSCEFISELRRLSKLSAEAVQNIDHFDPLKEYMHITRHTENDFRELMLKIAEVNHKQLVLVCGSAGDGKSHLLSYLKYSDRDGILDAYTIINDATESDAPNQTAIETLAEKIVAFRDDHLDDGGCEKVVLAINLGMLNNFIDSEQSQYFGKLKQYVLNNNIFSVAQPLPFDKNAVFHHIDFSNYQLYTLTADGVKSDYLTELFEKVFGNNPCNPFYNTYINQGSTCPHHTQCPVRHNFEFLMKAEVRNLLIQRIIEVCIKDKLVVTSRDVLNFIFDAVVSPDFDEKNFWSILSNPAKFLETYISYTTPMLIFENKGMSSLIDCMTENAKSNENIENRDGDVLNFYAVDDISPIVSSVLNGSEYSDILNSIGLSAIDNGRDSLKKYIYKFLMNYKKLSDFETLEDDQLYLSFVKDLYHAYAGNIKYLKNLYSSVKQSIYSWNGSYGSDLICIDDSSDDYSILEQLNIEYDVVQGSGDDEVLQFSPVILVRFCNESKTDQVSFSIDYSLYRVIMAMKDGYCPTSQDRNVHADFSSGITALSEFGTKNREFTSSQSEKRAMRNSCLKKATLGIVLRRCNPVFKLDPEMMKKTFLMGENGTNFTHRPAQHIKLFPVTTNSTGVTSFSTVIGEWLRLASGQKKVPESMEVTLKKLADSMDDIGAYEKEQLLQIAQSIYWNDDKKHSLRPKSITSMCYIPCDDQTALKMAQYLYSVLGSSQDLKNAVNQAMEYATKESNVLEKAVFEALEAKNEPPTRIDPYYVVHLAPQKIFIRDLKFVLKNTVRTKEYFLDLLEFYYFFYTSQTCLALSRFEYGDRTQIVPLYFSLDWEKTNKARECYTFGWQRLLPAIEQQFYHAITLEILNQNPDPAGMKFDYIALREYVEKTGAEEEVSAQIRCACDLYRNAFPDCIELRDLQKNEQLGMVFSEVNYLYESVRTQFKSISGQRGSANDRYVKHFETFCHDRFLKPRGASGLMLNITEEFLIFITKLAIQDEEKLSLNEVFRQFELRGIFLDQPSKEEVVQFYTKLNLIEKKSDSGDAQYVRRIL